MSQSQQRLTTNGDRWWPFEECPGWLEHIVKNEDGTPKEGKHDPGDGSNLTYTVSYSQKYKRWAIYENKKGRYKKQFGPGIPQTGQLVQNRPVTIDTDNTTISTERQYTEQEDKWDKIRERQDSRDKEFEARHKESMFKLDAAIEEQSTNTQMLRVIDQTFTRVESAIAKLDGHIVELIRAMQSTGRRFSED